jgi:DNA mismatch repair protein MutS
MTAAPFRDADPPAPPPAAGTAATPVMAQYHEIKRAHPGCLLFFRMGDFYELFFEDAQEAAPALDIALTRRGRHDGCPCIRSTPISPA